MVNVGDSISSGIASKLLRRRTLQITQINSLHCHLDDLCEDMVGDTLTESLSPFILLERQLI